MTSTDLTKALSLLPVIREAHEEAEKCQRSSHGRALEHAIKAGDALNLAKEAVGHGAFSIWRQQNLPHIPQTTASLYMRLAEHKEKFRDSQISNTVATLSAQGKLSLRAAAALLPKRPQTATQIAAAKARKEAKAAAQKGNEGIATEWFKALERDDLLTWWRQLRGDDDLREYIATAVKALQPQATMQPLAPHMGPLGSSSVEPGSSAVVRRA
jgi:hypothetical protein